jgi:hypothetical protein
MKRATAEERSAFEDPVLQAIAKAPFEPSSAEELEIEREALREGNYVSGADVSALIAQGPAAWEARRRRAIGK